MTINCLYPDDSAISLSPPKPGNASITNGKLTCKFSSPDSRLLGTLPQNWVRQSLHCMSKLLSTEFVSPPDPQTWSASSQMPVYSFPPPQNVKSSVLWTSWWSGANPHQSALCRRAGSPRCLCPDTQGKQPKHILVHKSTFTCAQTSSFIRRITARF